MAFTRLPAPERSRSSTGFRPGRTFVLAVLSVALLSAAAPAAFAGRLHPGVQAELAKLGMTDQATVLFIMKSQANIPALNNALKIEHATRKDRHFRVVTTLQDVARESQAPFLAELRARTAKGDVAGFTAHWIMNLVVVRATRAAIEELANRPDVDVVEPNFQPVLIKDIGPQGGRGIGVTPGLRAINAPEVWYGLGIIGTGAIISNIDTGVDGNHVALKARWRGNNGHPWQECWLDVLGTNTQYPNDGYGHGTHTMGTMTGLGATTQDSIGVAWGAEWIASNAINQGVGPEFDNDVVTSFEWIADPDGNPNTVDDVPDVCQNSWGINEGFGYNYTDCDTRWWQCIDDAEAAGVIVTFSAGNEGPGAGTLRSPADRATTTLNCFSVGAVDATDYNWPYPIADFSSRGPSGCKGVPPENLIKPEVAAPGYQVYSSYPGNQYEYMSGTSMAGPHVAGTLALMRSANPDLDVDSAKQILLDTARDEGDTGEDNTYGWGFIDAYQAVLHALVGYGTISGRVTNASNGGNPLAGATVTVVELNKSFTTDSNGNYSGMIQHGTYTVEASLDGFQTLVVPNVVVNASQVTEQDFGLLDNSPPAISGTIYPSSVIHLGDALVIKSTITDFSNIATKEVVYRVNGGDFTAVPMTATIAPNQYQGMIPGQPWGTNVDFYVHAVDVAGNAAVDPPGAPANLYHILVQQAYFTDNFESDRGWIPFQKSDTQNGRWARWDPIGQQYQGQQTEPVGDHTPLPGTMCYNTGEDNTPNDPEGSDVDNGSVTLTSPVIDLHHAQTAQVTYSRWFAFVGAGNASWTAQVSNDNGTTWTTFETLTANTNSWNQFTYQLDGKIQLRAQMVFRFIVYASQSTGQVVEGALDDFAVQGIPVPATSVDQPALPAQTVLLANEPNPFTGETTIRYSLAANASANLAIYDPSGRLVRTLVSGQVPAGVHAAVWDGRDEAGNRAAAGVYFYSLKTAGVESRQKLLLVR